MSGPLDGVKSFYFSLEDGYYALLDRIQKVIPVYSLVDPIDKIIPSFMLVLGLFVLLIAGMGLFVMGGLPSGGEPTVALTLTFTDEDDAPVSGAVITLTSLGESGESLDKITDDAGQVEYKVVPGDYTISASADGFDDFSQDVTVNTAKQLQFQLSPQAPAAKSRTLIITDDEGTVLGTSSPVTISLSFACQSGTPPADQTVFKGNTSVLQPSSCVGLSATVSVSGFVTKSQPILGDTTTIQLMSEDDVVVPVAPTKGSIEVVVKDKDNKVVPGVQIKLYKSSPGASDVLVSQSLTDTGGFAALFDVLPGKYKLTATKQGFKIYTSAEFQVNAGEKNTLSATLEKSSTSKKFFVKVLSSEDQHVIVGATVILFLQTNTGKYIEDGTYTTDSNGTVNQPVGDFNAGVQVVVSHSSYVTKIIPNQGVMLADESTPIPILVDPTDPKGTNGNIPNALIADVKVLDLLGFPVSNADTILYTSDLNGIFVGKKKSNASGIAKYENLPAGTYQAKASTSNADGNSVKVTGSINNTIALPITLDNGTAAIEVTVKDSFNKPIADANVWVYQSSSLTVLGQAITNATGVAKLSVKTADQAFVKTSKSTYIPFNSVPFGIIKDNEHKINAEMALASATPQLDVVLMNKQIYELSTTGVKTLASAINQGVTYEFHFLVKAPVEQANVKSLVRVNGKSPAQQSSTDVGSLVGGKSAKGGLSFYTATASDEFAPPVASATTSEGPAKVMINSLGSTSGSGTYELIALVTVSPTAAQGTTLELAYQAKSDTVLSALHVENYVVGAPLPPQGDFGYQFFISLAGSNQKTQISSALPVKIEANKDYTLDYIVSNASLTSFTSPIPTISFTFPTGTVTPSMNNLIGFTDGKSVSGSVTVRATNPCTQCSSLVASLGNVGTGKSPTTYSLNIQVIPEKEITLKATPTFLIPGLTQTVSVVALDNDGNPLNSSNLVQVTGKFSSNDEAIPFTGSTQGVFIASIDKADAFEGESVEITGTAPGYLNGTLIVPISSSGIGNFSQDFSCIKLPSQGNEPFFTLPSNGTLTIETENCLESVKIYTSGDGDIELMVTDAGNTFENPEDAVTFGPSEIKSFSLSRPSDSPGSFGLYPVYVYAKYASQPDEIEFVKVGVVDVQVNPLNGANHCLNLKDGYVIDITDGSDASEVENNCNPLVKDPFLPSATLELDGAFARALPSVITPALQTGAAVPFSWQVDVHYDFSNTDDVTIDDYPTALSVQGDANWYRYEILEAADIVTDPSQYSNPILIPDVTSHKVGGENQNHLEYKDESVFPFYKKGVKSVMYETTLMIEEETFFKYFCVAAGGIENTAVFVDGERIHKGKIQSVNDSDKTNCGDMDPESKNVTLSPGPHVVQIMIYDADADKDYWSWFGYKPTANTANWKALGTAFSLNPQYGVPAPSSSGESGTLSYPPAAPQNGMFPLSSKGAPIKIGTLEDSDDNPIRSVLTNANLLNSSLPGGEQLKMARIQTYSSDPAIRVFVKDFDVYAQYVGFDEPALHQNVVFENTGLEGTRYAVLSLSDYEAKNKGTKLLNVGILLDGSASVLLNADDLPNATSNTKSQNGLCSFLQNIEKGMKYYSNSNVTFKIFVMNQPTSFTGAPCGGTILTVPVPVGFDPLTQSNLEFWAEGAKAVADNPFWDASSNKLLIVVTDTKATGSAGALSQYTDGIDDGAASVAGAKLSGKGIRAAVLYKTPIESTAVHPTTKANKAIASYGIFSTASLGDAASSISPMVEALDYSEFIPSGTANSSSLYPFEQAENNKVVQRLAQFAFGVTHEKMVVKVMGPEANACLGENGEVGVTGKVNHPNMLLNWKWDDDGGVSMSLCDAKTGTEAANFAYCDGTQFMITLVKKLNTLNQALGSNATPAQIAQIPFLKTFDAFLIRDGYTMDFRNDFVTTNISTEFADAPAYFTGSTSLDGAWKDYVTPGAQLIFKMNTDSSADANNSFVLPATGLYRVQIDYSSPTFFSAGSPSSIITVTFTQLATAKGLSNYSEFTEIPFDGLVGIKKTGTTSAPVYQFARQGYGAGFTGNTILDISDPSYTKGVVMRTYPSESGSTPLVPLTVSHEKSFIPLNTGTKRGVGAEYNKATGTLAFRTAIPTPVLAEWSSDSSGAGEFFYGIQENVLQSAGQYLSYDTSAGPLAKWVPVASLNQQPSVDCDSCNVCLDAGSNPYELSTLADHNPSGNECSNFISTLGAGNTYGFSTFSGSPNTSYLSSIFYHDPTPDYKMIGACNPSGTGIPEGMFLTPIGPGGSSNETILDMEDTMQDFKPYADNPSLNELLDLVSNPTNDTAEGWTCVASTDDVARIYWNGQRLRDYIVAKANSTQFGVITPALECKAAGTPLFNGDFWTLTQETKAIPSGQANSAFLCPLYNDVPSAGQYNVLGIPYPVGSKVYIPGSDEPESTDPINTSILYRFNPTSCSKNGSACGTGAYTVCTDNTILEWKD